MSHYDLTRADAAARSATLSLRGATVHLDLTHAPGSAEDSYPVTVEWEFDSTVESTFLDYIGDVTELVINGSRVAGAQLAEVVGDGRIELLGLSACNKVTVRARSHFSRTGEGMHRYVDPEDGQTYLYTQFEPTDARRMVPCFDQPDLRTEWRFVVDAPEGWSVSSNSGTVETTEGPSPGSRQHTFAASASLPSYLTSVLAGPYHRVDSSWAAKNPQREQRLPLTLWCRAAMAEHLPAEELFELTRQGLDFYTELFDLDFPFDSYEQAFVPEYNLGAMENPGLVTFTEDYLFPEGPTHQQRAARANTVLHEMAHMYFGDLVTIRWWEDLWLKESFAEFMGSHASAEATEFTGAWAGFAVRRKAWAYRQDALSTTHPVVAEVPDVAAAMQNFDGITYAKGASALKQLVAFVGIDAFVAACRLYFRRHAWGCAELDDFLAALAQSSTRDTRAWARDWLSTTGATVFDVGITRDGTGPDAPVTRAVLVPRGTPQDPGSSRPHHLVVGVYGPAAAGGGTLTRERRIVVDVPAGHVPGHEIEVPELVGATGLVLVNDDDLDYAQHRPDHGELHRLLSDLSALPDAMARSVAWATLWSEVRDARLDPGDFLDAVVAHIGLETESVVFETVLERALESLEDHLPRRRRPDARLHLVRFVVTALQEAAPGSDRQMALARVFGDLLARDGTYAGWARDLLTGAESLPGLRLGPALRWRFMTGLVASNHAVESWILKESARDSSRQAQTGRARTLAARPTRWAKDAAWQEILGADLSNDLLSATIAGFQLADDRLLAAYRDQYFAMLAQQWDSRSIGMATRLVAGLYPRGRDLTPGAAVEEDEIVLRTEAWLVEHPEAPAALRRVITERLDERRRLLGIQANARPR